MRIPWKCYEENFISSGRARKGVSQEVIAKLRTRLCGGHIQSQPQPQPLRQWIRLLPSVASLLSPCSAPLPPAWPSLPQTCSSVFWISHEQMFSPHVSFLLCRAPFGGGGQFPPASAVAWSFSVSARRTIFVCYFHLTLERLFVF